MTKFVEPFFQTSGACAVIVAEMLHPQHDYFEDPATVAESPKLSEADMVQGVYNARTHVPSTWNAPKFSLHQDQPTFSIANETNAQIIGVKLPTVKINKTAELFASVESRLVSLRQMAVDESIEVSTNSENDLFAFLTLITPTKRPLIALLDDGKMRASWRGQNGQQIGIKFLGNERAQFVLLGSCNSHSSPSELLGTDSISMAASMISKFFGDELNKII